MDLIEKGELCLWWDFPVDAVLFFVVKKRNLLYNFFVCVYQYMFEREENKWKKEGLEY